MLQEVLRADSWSGWGERQGWGSLSRHLAPEPPTKPGCQHDPLVLTPACPATSPHWGVFSPISAYHPRIDQSISPSSLRFCLKLLHSQMCFLLSNVVQGCLFQAYANKKKRASQPWPTSWVLRTQSALRKLQRGALLIRPDQSRVRRALLQMWTWTFHD